MQGDRDMTLDTEALSPRTTAAGLEAWLSGAHAVPEQVDAPVASEPAPAVMAVPAPVLEVAEEIPPVNAAEALALSAVLGTFSSPRKLTGPDGAELIVDPENNAYHFESTALKPLAALLSQPATSWMPVYVEAVKAARAANPAQSLERLRWYAGLVATPGILSRKLSRKGRYKLSRWPETEREFPKHFRIAKEMSKEPASLAEIVAASGMPEAEVVDYINASFAGGKIEPAKAAPAVVATASRGGRLIARLNKPLFGR